MKFKDAQNRPDKVFVNDLQFKSMLQRCELYAVMRYILPSRLPVIAFHPCPQLNARASRLSYWIAPVLVLPSSLCKGEM